MLILSVLICKRKSCKFIQTSFLHGMMIQKVHFIFDLIHKLPFIKTPLYFTMAARNQAL